MNLKAVWQISLFCFISISCFADIPPDVLMRIQKSFDWKIEPALQAKMKILNNEANALIIQISEKGNIFGVDFPDRSHFHLNFRNPKEIRIFPNRSSEPQSLKYGSLEFTGFADINTETKRPETIGFSREDEKKNREYKGYKVTYDTFVILNPETQKAAAEKTKVPVDEVILKRYDPSSDGYFSAELILLKDQNINDVQMPKHSRLNFSEGKLMHVELPTGKVLEIKKISCEGSVIFQDSGLLKCLLSKEHSVDGVRVPAKTEITFDPSGKLSFISSVRSEIKIGKKKYPAGSNILIENGEVKVITDPDQLDRLRTWY